MYRDVSELKDKRILIVGLGKTGVSLCHFLTQHQAKTLSSVGQPDRTFERTLFPQPRTFDQIGHLSHSNQTLYRVCISQIRQDAIDYRFIF